MQIVRTPDARFENLPDFPYAPSYAEIPDGEGGSLRMHYVEAGPKDGETIVLMHGQPSWCFLYRKMIPILADAGHRVLAVDLIGFGRSDKPTERNDHTYARHVTWMTAFFEALDLRDVTLYCQDWGSLIGIRVVADQPERFARVVVANGALPDGTVGIPLEHCEAMRKLRDGLPVPATADLGTAFANPDGPPAFLLWQKYCSDSVPLPIVEFFGAITRGEMSPEIAAGYAAPFPDDTYCAAPHRFPTMVPLFLDDPEIPANQAAWNRLAAFDRPFQTAFSDSDPITAGFHELFQSRVAGCKDVDHVTIEDAGHFLQEDQGEACARELLRFIEAHPRP